MDGLTGAECQVAGQVGGQNEANGGRMGALLGVRRPGHGGRRQGTRPGCECVFQAGLCFYTAYVLIHIPQRPRLLIYMISDSLCVCVCVCVSRWPMFYTMLRHVPLVRISFPDYDLCGLVCVWRTWICMCVYRCVHLHL